MSINQSQPRMRLHPILLHSRFHQKPAASLVFGLFSARILAARLAGGTRSELHPCTPHLRREFPKRRVLFPLFPLTKTTNKYFIFRLGWPSSTLSLKPQAPLWNSARQFRRASALLSVQ
jgi:hypothetical protein